MQQNENKGFLQKNITYLIHAVTNSFRTLLESCPQFLGVHNSESLMQSFKLGETFLHLP